MTHQLITIVANTKSEFFASLAEQLESLLQGEHDLIANAANLSSLLYHSMPELNWAGFYFVRDGELVLGPFQGKPACVRIALGKGVCGTAGLMRETVIVPNVHEFPGHIACDGDSTSEIVVPLVRDGDLIGVLDLDSPHQGRFDEEDARGLNRLVELFLKSLEREKDDSNS